MGQWGAAGVGLRKDRVCLSISPESISPDQEIFREDFILSQLMTFDFAQGTNWLSGVEASGSFVCEKSPKMERSRLGMN